MENKSVKKELFRTLKFVLFSASAGIIEFGSFTLLDLLTNWNYWPKYLIALVLSVIWNFTLNRRYTFRSASNVPKAMFLVFLYYLAFTPLSTWLGEWLSGTHHWNEYLVTILNMLLNFVTEFLFDRFVVFGKSIDTNELARREQEKAAETPSEHGSGDGID